VKYIKSREYKLANETKCPVCGSQVLGLSEWEKITHLKGLKNVLNVKDGILY